ncbi:MAG: type II secretion system F family protein [Candidatus Thermoplasmatota archaeon]
MKLPLSLSFTTIFQLIIIFPLLIFMFVNEKEMLWLIGYEIFALYSYYMITTKAKKRKEKIYDAESLVIFVAERKFMEVIYYMLFMILNIIVVFIFSFAIGLVLLGHMDYTRYIMTARISMNILIFLFALCILISLPAISIGEKFFELGKTRKYIGLVFFSSLSILGYILAYVFFSLPMSLIILMLSLCFVLFGIFLREEKFIPQIVINLVKIKELKGFGLSKKASYTLILILIIIYFLFAAYIIAPTAATALSTILLKNPLLTIMIIVELVLIILVIIKVFSIVFGEKREIKKYVVWDICRIAILLTTAIITTCFIIVIGLSFIGFLPYRDILLELVIFALILCIGPYSIYDSYSYKKMKEMEEEFPRFLNEVAEICRSGASLFVAIKVASTKNYGALTKEIKKMAIQLTWNISMEEVLRLFEERVRTSLMKRSINIMIEANRSGGNFADVLTATANDFFTIKMMEKERKANTAIYLLIFYVGFIVFLLVIITMAVLLFPLFKKIGEFNPEPYLTSYYIAIFVQALTNGVVAGQLAEGRWSTGIKHGIIMIIISYVVFKVLVGF